MFKNRLFVQLSLLLSVCLLGHAAPITQEQAQQEAVSFLLNKQKTTNLKFVAKGNRTLQAVPQPEAAYYVFNIGTDQGFVIVSGDDRTVPILGYSDEGHFDLMKAPANMQSWLDEYAQQISLLDKMSPADLGKALVAPKAERVVDTRNSIAPLVTTKWNQADPYWNKCPEFMSIDENGDTIGELAYSGCVAVSMSQIMNYHKWPIQTTKVIPSYTFNYNLGGYEWATIEMEPQPVTTFDWEHMKDSYNGSEDAVYTDAVATLMLYAGCAVKSQYGVSSTGAYTDDIPKGFTEYFAYDPSTIQIKFRTDFTQEVWDNMVYEELAAGRPMIYNGTAGSGGGHSFVCDGYEYGNYFHINWGWGGMGNGYFQLAVLNPRESGIGGSSSAEGYNMKQNIIIGIQPGDPSGSGTPEPQVEDALTVTGLGLYSNGYDEKTYIERDGVNYGFSVYKRQFFKLSNADHVGTQKKYDVGVALYDMDNNFLSMIINRGTYSTSLTSALGSTDNLGGNLEARDAKKFGAGMTGLYKIVPMYQLEGTTEWKPMLESDRFYLEIDMSAYSATLTSHPILGLQIEGMEFEGGEKVGSQERIHVTLKNNSADRYFGDLYLQLGSQQIDEYSQYTTSIQAEVLSGETKTVTFNVTPANAGTQTIRLYYDANCEKPVTGSGTVTIAPLVPSTMNLSVAIVADNAVDGIIYDSHAHFKVDITNNGTGEYNKYILAPLFVVHKDESGNVTGGDMITYSQSGLNLQPGETKTMYFDFNDLAYGSTYSLNIYARNENDQLVNLVPRGQSVYYDIRRGLVTWDGSGMTGTGVAASGDITVPANALAARLEGLEIGNVTPSGNPNTLYFIGENEAVPAGLEGLNVVKGNVAERIVLKDGFGYFTPQSFTAQSISYERTFDKSREDGVAENWSTIVLPFAPATVSSSEMWIERFAQEADGEVVFSEVENFEANVPYIISVKKTADLTTPVTWSASDVLLKAEPIAYTSGEQYLMAGTFVNQNIEGIYAVDNAGAIAKWAEGAQIVAPFRAYFKEINPLEQHADILLPGEAQQGIYGDVNCDGFVTSADVTAIYDVLLGTDNTFESTADVNGDGFVTSADVTAVYDILLGN